MTTSTNVPGRACPVGYRYPASALASADELHAEVLYVAGGLYGNLEAWRALLDLLEAEEAATGGGVALALSGDFHWLDADPAWFAAVERATAPHHRLRGNVEAEVADPAPGVGCGCAYPAEVPDAVVERSNRMLERLRGAASPSAVAALAGLPRYAVARVGETRWGLVHGDAESVAGWGFGVDALDRPAEAEWRRRVFRASGLDGYASSHTGAPALRGLEVDGRERVIVNNGAAGLPNFAGERCGVVTRVATEPPPAGVPALYGRRLRDVTVHAIALHYDHVAFERRFLALWPEGSDGHVSYHSRIRHGPAFSVAGALGHPHRPT